METSNMILENGREVIIGQECYLLYNTIDENKSLLESYNELSKAAFGLPFETVGGYHTPHVLVKDNVVCANVTVNQTHFSYNNRPVFYIQIGRVMTREEYRGRGLGRWLIEYIIDQWEERCEGIYLFANDRVLDFYPRFGFVRGQEFGYRIPIPQEKKNGKEGGKVQKLQLDHPKHSRLILEKYREGNPFSKFYMTDNSPTFSFHFLGMLKDSVHYLPEYHVLVFAGEEKGEFWCYDIYGNTQAELEEIIQAIAPGSADEARLGFSPRNREQIICESYKREGATLFVRCNYELPLYKDKVIFPVISHA